LVPSELWIARHRTTNEQEPLMPESKLAGLQAYTELLHDLDNEELAEELRFIRRLLESAYEETHDRSKAAAASQMEGILNAEDTRRELENLSTTPRTGVRRVIPAKRKVRRSSPHIHSPYFDKGI
jgi:hypothetical protein